MSALVYDVVTAVTPRRDVDLFGATTVRLDRGGVPVLYLSAYAQDAVVLAKRLVGALAWLDDTQTAQAVHDAEKGRPEIAAAAEAACAYTMPAFVEDVDYSDRLTLADKPEDTDWKAWAAAITCRVDLATTASQLAALESANDIGLKLCPGRFRQPISKALRDAYEVTQDQAAAA